MPAALVVADPAATPLSVKISVLPASGVPEAVSVAESVVSAAIGRRRIGGGERRLQLLHDGAWLLPFREPSALSVTVTVIGEAAGCGVGVIERECLVGGKCQRLNAAAVAVIDGGSPGVGAGVGE